jgi:tetratricopeptide (TPR) repeat protein
MFEPMTDARTIPRLGDQFVMVRAINLDDRSARTYYMDLSLPERINDYTYVLDGHELHQIPTYTFEPEGVVIPAVACEVFGDYALYYSRPDPEVGIAVLREGLTHATNKTTIAEDLGYICRDEGRVQEAIDAFSIAIGEGPSTYFTYLERATLHDQIGDTQAAATDRQTANQLAHTLNLPNDL